MKIYLAGYNTDVQFSGNTPETLSAAYARISRDPRPVHLLREEACGEVERARESNRRIVFGYGHGSVAEHAVFNFDILDVSRLAAEELQNFRLASFTEKSQRYVRLKEDFVIPEELKAENVERFRESMHDLHARYDALYHGLREKGFPMERAREDARYVLPMATSCQMGMTVNARELEHMVRRLSCHPFREVRAIAVELLRLASRAAPSLFIFLEPTAMDGFAHSLQPAGKYQGDEVLLVESDDDSMVGKLLVQWKTGAIPEESSEAWNSMSQEERLELFMEALEGLGIHDHVPRQWEFFRAIFRLVVSSGAYAQLKRHRMCTRLASVYDPSLGVTIPPGITRAGLEELFMNGIRKAEELSGRLGVVYPYALTNAHRRVVTLSMNGRELYHFSRLREDEHAQWDIRTTAHRMMELLRERAPLTFMLAGGKSAMT